MTNVMELFCAASTKYSFMHVWVTQISGLPRAKLKSTNGVCSYTSCITTRPTNDKTGFHRTLSMKTRSHTQHSMSDVTSQGNTDNRWTIQSPLRRFRQHNTYGQQQLKIPWWQVTLPYVHAFTLSTSCVLNGRINSRKCGSRENGGRGKLWNAITSRSWLWALRTSCHIQNYITDSCNAKKPLAAKRHQKIKRKDNGIGAHWSLRLKQELFTYFEQ